MPKHRLHFFSLLTTKIKLNLRAEAGRSQLGYAWWLLEPLLQASVFYVVFGVFLARTIENFVAFLLTGLIPWTWLNRSIGNSMGSLRASRGYLANFRIHPMFFPLLELGQDAVKQLFTFAFLVLFLLIYGINPTPYWMLLPFLMLLQMLLIIPVASFIASIIPLLEDLAYLVNTLLLLGMFASGIFYDPNVVVTDEWRSVYFLNPGACVIQAYRDIMLYARLPELYHIAVPLIWALFFSLLTLVSMSRLRRKYALLILA
ncbi:MAG: ABC transporter permease [Pseudomonadota bacterium]